MRDQVMLYATSSRRWMMLFGIGDCLAGMLMGGVTALAVRGIVAPGLDMVVAMMVGMAVGMILHLVIGLLLSPLLGMFETMTSGSVIGMYGGMLFGMRDSMSAGSRTLPATILVGALFGLVVVLCMKVYDAVLRGPVVDTGE